ALSFFGIDGWATEMGVFIANRISLSERYAKERRMAKIPLVLDDKETLHLSAGEHSQLIKEIVEEFGPRFAPGAELIYIGDTGAKEGYFRKERLTKLGVTVNNHGKMPDVVLYWEEKNWLFLIE